MFNASGCSANSAITGVTVNAIPTIAVTPALITIISGNSTTLTASGASTYSWSPATGLSATTGSVVIANPTVTTTYTVTGTTINGCVGTASVTVTVNQPLLCLTPITVSNGLDTCGRTVYYVTPVATAPGGSLTSISKYYTSNTLDSFTVPAGVTSVTIGEIGRASCRERV